MTTMTLFQDDKHQGHEPQFFLQSGIVKACEERGERAGFLLDGSRRAGLNEAPVSEWASSYITAIHTPEYYKFLSEAYGIWQQLPNSGPEVLANVHPMHRRPGAYPTSIIGRAGWHMADLACAIGPGTFEAARGAANVALSAADSLMETGIPAYALCRPPGHHASADAAAGHCYFNNTAIATQHLRSKFHKIAIIDIDVHHGNGTQSIFYDRNDVLTVSIHADPAHYYPFYQGYTDERGEGPGTQYNMNFPLPVGTGEAEWFTALGQGLSYAVNDFGADCMVIATGLDAHESDPLGAFKITTEGFRKAGNMIGGLAGSKKLPVLMVQEGGYLSPNLADNIDATLSGFQKSYS